MGVNAGLLAIRIILTYSRLRCNGSDAGAFTAGAPGATTGRDGVPAARREKGERSTKVNEYGPILSQQQKVPLIRPAVPSQVLQFSSQLRGDPAILAPKNLADFFRLVAPGCGTIVSMDTTTSYYFHHSLTPRQQYALLHLAAGHFISSVARELNASRTTIYSWLKRDDFQYELTRRTEYLQDIALEAQTRSIAEQFNLSDQATDELVEKHRLQHG